MRDDKGNNRNEGKKKRKGGVIYNIITLILVCVIVFSLYNIGKILWGYYYGSKTYEKIETMAGIDGDIPSNIDFEKLAQTNSDIKAWLFLKDSKINYPVVKTNNNDYYLTRLFNKEYNSKGTLFVDFRNEAHFEDFNTIIYGHKTKDTTMFSELINYKEQEFYDKHKKMMLFTPEKKYDIEIFSIVQVEPDSDRYKLYFNEFEKAPYIQWAKDNSLLPMDVSVSPEDKIVMFSTCSDFEGTGRIVVYGKLVPVE